MSDIASVVLTIVGVSVVLAQCRKPRGWPGRFLRLVDEPKSFQSDRLGVDPCRHRKTRHRVGCRVRWRQDGSEAGNDRDRRQGLRNRLFRGQCQDLTQPERAGDTGRPRRDPACVCLAVAVSRRHVRSRHRRRDPLLLARPDGDMREILRVLKPGGKLLMIAEAYKGSRYDIVYGVVKSAQSRVLDCRGASPAVRAGRLFGD